MDIKELNKKLVEKYPYLLPRNVWTDEVAEDYDYSYIRGVEIPVGWVRLFLLYCKNLRPILEKANYLDKYRFSQVKEKYAGLCIYDFGNTEEGFQLATIYRHLSYYVCFDCGGWATKTTVRGYIEQFCDKCVEKHFKPEVLEELEAVSKEDAKTYKYSRSSADGEKFYEVDTSRYVEEYDRCKDMSDDDFFAYILED